MTADTSPKTPQEIGKALSELPEKQLSRLFEKQSPSNRVQSLTEALLQKFAVDDAKERLKRETRFQYLHELRDSLLSFARSVDSSTENVEKIRTSIKNQMLVSQEYNVSNLHVDAIANIGKEFHQMMATIESLRTVTHQFANENKTSVKNVESTPNTLSYSDAKYETLDLATKTLLEVIDTFIKEMDQFVPKLESLLNTFKEYYDYVKLTYGNMVPEEEPNDDAKTLFDLLIGKARSHPKADVPIFRKNIRLTAFLHEIIKSIPEPTIKEKSRSKTLASLGVEDFHFSTPEMTKFVTSIISYGQPMTVIMGIGQKELFEAIGKTLNEIRSMYESIGHGLEYAAFQKVRIQDPESAGYMRDYKETQKRLEASQSLMARTRKISDIATTFEAIDFNRIPIDSTETHENKKGTQRERDQLFFQLFVKIWEKIDETGKLVTEKLKEIKGEHIVINFSELSEFVKEMMVLKYHLDNLTSGKARSSKRVRADSQRDNYAYSVSMEGINQLSLKQIPTQGTRFQDIIGESWRQIEKQIHDVLDFGDLEHVFTQLSPRRRFRNHMLILGPYGCGKNEFMRALMSTPEMVGVQMTTERILTAYAGEFEANVRRLFEEAYKKRLLHEKPVMIGWDEFDSFFGKPSAGHSYSDGMFFRAQKILQSVLDGDTEYDGLFLCGVSNEPDKIPIPIYRRFRYVSVIQALSPEERVVLAKKFLEGIPQSEDFDSAIDWDVFRKKTDHASGDMLGKLADLVFKSYLAEFRATRPQRLRNINAELEQLLLGGKPITPEIKRRLFLKGNLTKRIFLTPQMFHNALNRTFGDSVIQDQLRQQQNFYKRIDEVMKKTLSGEDEF